MPSKVDISDHKELVNWRPWSVVMSPGTPKWATQERKRALAQSSAVIVVRGTASNHLVYLSTIVNR